MLGKMKIIDNLNLFSTNFFIDILYLILKDGLKWLLVNVAQMNDVVPGLIVIHLEDRVTNQYKIYYYRVYKIVKKSVNQ